MYDEPVSAFARGELDWENSPVWLMLVTGDYVPSQTSHASVNDVRRFEVQASGSYSRGGAELGGREVVRSEGNEVKLGAGGVRWQNFTGRFRYAVAYEKSTGLLIGYADLGRQESTNAVVQVEYRDGFADFAVDAAPGGVPVKQT